MNTNTAEKEIIGICISTEAIDDIINHTLLEFQAIEDCPGEAIVHFPSRVHQQLFLIRLLDFAKESGDFGLTGIKGSCLDVLSAASTTQSFEKNGNVTLLRQATENLRNWLETPTTLKLWLPNIQLEVSLNVPRLQLLFISGNQAKHNISRLTGLSKKIQEMLRNHGHDVPLEQVPLILENFTEHLDDNFFIYYGTWLSELLNNIRWGIQQYLLPTYHACYNSMPEIDDRKYEYTYPEPVQGEIAKSWFWRMMEHIRSKPYVKQFTAGKHMKLESIS